MNQVWLLNLFYTESNSQKLKVLSEIGIETMGQMESAPGAHSSQLGGQKEADITDKDIENILAGLKS